jgi:hypothetical protein
VKPTDRFLFFFDPFANSGERFADSFEPISNLFEPVADSFDSSANHFAFTTVFFVDSGNSPLVRENTR